ncbi:MAG: 3D domain-containing protein [Candidatus Liptonbacteria bacterium]|nr:3D domain-containing protein [Candidatus Liptonbacteria bacterium]
MRIVHVTAYSSTPEETDDTPFVTASGTAVRDGVIAANFLPFGTKVQIPRLFGQKLFVVEDRMHRRKENFVDIWMPAKSDALRFGIHEAELIILADGEGK